MAGNLNGVYTFGFQRFGVFNMKHAFHDQLRRLYPSWRGANVLALGDGMADLTAATDACASMSNCYVKGVKFLGAPSVAQLDRQLGVFVENLPVLVDYAASFRVCMAAS